MHTYTCHGRFSFEVEDLVVLLKWLNISVLLYGMFKKSGRVVTYILYMEQLKAGQNTQQLWFIFLRYCKTWFQRSSFGALTHPESIDVLSHAILLSIPFPRQNIFFVFLDTLFSANWHATLKILFSPLFSHLIELGQSNTIIIYIWFGSWLFLLSHSHPSKFTTTIKVNLKYAYLRCPCSRKLNNAHNMYRQNHVSYSCFPLFIIKVLVLKICMQ